MPRVSAIDACLAGQMFRVNEVGTCLVGFSYLA